MKSQNAESMREEIERRVAAFRERQQRFNKVRDDYFKQTVARARDDLKRLGTPSPQDDSATDSRIGA
jgi:hypothetical protein